jgi:type IV secretion system protein VirB5
MNQAEELRDRDVNRVTTDITPETRYTVARQGWDDRYGHAVLQARNWRLAFFTLCPLLLLFAAWCIWQSTQARVRYIPVFIDRVTGAYRAGPQSEHPTFRPGELEISATLRAWIEETRSVSTDPVVLRNNNTTARWFMNEAAVNHLNQEQSAWEPLQHIGAESVTVEGITLEPIPGSNSWSGDWYETRYNAQGDITERYRMSATLSVIKAAPPDDLQGSNINPFGIYITAFDWTRKTEAATPTN